MLARGDEWNVMTCVWALTWKQVEDGWKIKARLCLRGFQDRQGTDLHKYSPTAGRVAHRLLIIIAVMYNWRLISVDINAASLQGLPLDEAKTNQGNQRNVWARPPADA